MCQIARANHRRSAHTVAHPYARAERLGVDVRCLLIETWGDVKAQVKNTDEALTHAAALRRGRRGPVASPRVGSR